MPEVIEVIEVIEVTGGDHERALGLAENSRQDRHALDDGAAVQTSQVGSETPICISHVAAACVRPRFHLTETGTSAAAGVAAVPPLLIARDSVL